MLAQGLEKVLPTVTAGFAVQFKRVTPLDTELILRAWPVQVEGNRAVVEGQLEAGGVITATGTGTFVAVDEGHPAFFRW